jgi:predicted dehydrogenase
LDLPVDVLVVGGGSIGERHVRCFQHIGCTVALCDTSATIRQALTERYHLPRTFDSVEAAAEEIWYGVVICTPANLHVEHASILAPATSALLIEKPLSTSLDEARRLRGLSDKVIQVAYVLRHHPAAQHVRQLLTEGVIGTLHEITVVAGQHFPTFRPAYRDIYYAHRESGGGAVQDAATHLFDLVQHFAGPFDWIFCDYAHQELPDVEVEDTVHLLARAGGGRVLISLALNQFMAPNETHVQLNGSRGSLAIRFHEHRAGMLLHGDETWTWTEPLVEERDDLFRAQAEAFLAAAVGQTPPLCTLDDGIRALAVNLAALRSGASQAIERLSY